MISLYRSWRRTAEEAEAALTKIHPAGLPGLLQRCIDCWLRAAEYATGERRFDARYRASEHAQHLHQVLLAPEPGKRLA